MKMTNWLIGMFMTLSAVTVYTADRKSGVKRLARMIPYELGPKPALVNDAEAAFDRHPMISGALQGVLAKHRYCRLYDFTLNDRSENELRSTQFNGGELRVEFTYFCYTHSKREIEEASRRYESGEPYQPGAGWLSQPDQADVVLKISGDFSRKKKQIFDPNVSYSACYGHYCGSN